MIINEDLEMLKNGLNISKLKIKLAILDRKKEIVES